MAACRVFVCESYGVQSEPGYGCASCVVQRETGYGCASCVVQRETGACVGVCNYNFSKVQYTLPKDDRVIETCRSILNVLMYILYFLNYNWINQLSNTTIWWLDICCLLHRYQLHVSALMAIFRLID